MQIGKEEVRSLFSNNIIPSLKTPENLVLRTLSAKQLGTEFTYQTSGLWCLFHYLMIFLSYFEESWGEWGPWMPKRPGYLKGLEETERQHL